MDEIWRAKFILGTFLTSIMVGLSYQIPLQFFSLPPPLLILLSFILSGYTSDFIVNTSLNLKIGRKLILGKSWIEGYWILYSIESQEDDKRKTSKHGRDAERQFNDENQGPYRNPFKHFWRNTYKQKSLLNNPTLSKPGYDITLPALAHFSYVGEHFNLKVVTHRLNEQTKTLFPTISELATIRPFDLKYSNIYTITDGKTEGKGVARGQFYCEEATGFYPNMYDGYIVQYTDAVSFWQAGFKIPDIEIEKYKKRYERDWITPYLCMMHKQLQNKKKKVDLYSDDDFCSYP